MEDRQRRGSADKMSSKLGDEAAAAVKLAAATMEHAPGPAGAGEERKLGTSQTKQMEQLGVAKAEPTPQRKSSMCVVL